MDKTDVGNALMAASLIANMWMIWQNRKRRNRQTGKHRKKR